MQPIQLDISRVSINQLDAGHPLGDEPRHLEREERAPHAPDEAEDGERLNVGAAVGIDVPSHAEHAEDDRQREDDDKVSQEKRRLV